MSSDRFTDEELGAIAEMSRRAAQQEHTMGQVHKISSGFSAALCLRCGNMMWLVLTSADPDDLRVGGTALRAPCDIGYPGRDD
jgi:hypothetical protein